MKCREILLEIIPFYSGELDEEKTKEYRRHTTVCKDCARTSFRIRKAKNYIENNARKKE
ncbi:hypothetical protein Epro_0721 [Endomicrobium proavitum]|uniref:Zinc-finger domain-containing protein n=1 Tax=Endomicrobium proavitum TaxID=1408281 RepID=A0A0G3WJP4_9BACT|nr:hypothetical protein Epro_0721 [Endomicrobium proavitum]